MGNLSFQTRWLLSNWCGPFAPLKLHIFVFLCLFCLLIPVLTQHCSPNHLLQTQCLQQDECWLPLAVHYLIAHLVLYHFPNSFSSTNSISCSVRCKCHLLHDFKLHLIMYVFYRCQCFYFYVMLSVMVQLHVFFFITLSLDSIMN